ncbi:MAG TPA: helix-turn-helix domain-containing protein [Ferruginibacter sp.]|nr:helix-turn-helix domain-containing protein [Ferruginibacter sp.]HRO17699.1 helix-turn-helix domain-containing protein [Ferruginibacter sp.]HRQ20864.1 helix-turn-helix domain-containing protein [Ferruginibacter sp.]
MQNVVLSPIPLDELIKEIASIVGGPKDAPGPACEKPITDDECVDIASLARFLNVTEQTIIKFKAKGLIPYLQIGRSVRFNKREVIEALRKTKR